MLLIQSSEYWCVDMANCTEDKKRIEALEQELNEMTIALSRAWDQLVPFLQDVPSQAETVGDIEPILHAVAAATMTDFAGVYLHRLNEWYSIQKFTPSVLQTQTLRQITQETLLNLSSKTGEMSAWLFVPVVSEGESIGALGIGTHDCEHVFTAVDSRILSRMAERIGGQITATQLTRLRERETIQKRDMQIAHGIQQSMQSIKPPVLEHTQLASYWNPAKEVGGDAMGWVQPSENRLTWFILDVAGKGLPASLAAVALHTAITTLLRMRLSPTETLIALNQQFYDAYTHTDLMATVAILSLDTERGYLEIANAGHPPILVKHSHQWLKLRATSPPIGVLPKLKLESQYLTLQHDDIVIAYSDGFSEIQLETRLWGQTGLLEAIPQGVKSAKELISMIVKASQNAGTADDDQTLVAVMYKTT